MKKTINYGVLNREGNTVVYPEYDSIGVSDEIIYVFNYKAEENKYLIFDNTIVVEKDGKYGFYNLNGKNTLLVNFEGIGYITESDENAYKNSSSSTNLELDEATSDVNSSSSVGNSVLTIDIELELDDGTIGAVKGIVVKQTGLDGEAAYGIYDAIQERLIIPCGCSRIYSITKSGVTTYYMEYNGTQLEFESYVKQNDLYTVINEAITEE